MASNNIKSLLKDAREALKNKDYQTSLKLCKTILKQDKENYMGLVFLGISLQEVGPTDQAKKAFLKAINVNSENVLAWNGLLNYYDQFENEIDTAHLIEVYLKILDLETNDKKLKEIYEKIEAIKFIPENLFPSVVNHMYKAAKSLKERNCISEGPWSAIVAVIWNKKDKTELSEEIWQMLEEALSELVHTSKWMSSDNYSKYLKVLHERKKYVLLLEECQRMHSIFEESTIPLEWVCKLYNQLEVEKDNLSAVFEPTAKEYYEILEKINPKSATVLFTNSLIHYKNGNILLARDVLKEVTSLHPKFLHGWMLLTSCYLKLKNFEEALKSSEHTQKLLKETNNTSTFLCNTVLDLELQILSMHSMQECWEKCIEKCKEIANGDKNRKLCMARSYMNLGKLIEAKTILNEINGDENDVSVSVLKANLLEKEGKTEDAIKLLTKLSENNNDSDVWFEVGLLHWKIHDYDKSAIPFLKAAKLNPNNYSIFLYLGHYYQKYNNIEKAKKCFEKAFKINSNCIEAALELGEIYRKLEDWDANLTLLRELAGGSVNEWNNWAWVQLGVSYLEKQDFNCAIDTWRYLVRCKPLNSHFWEGLADSYLARGSYTSALKCYQKAAEITPNALYPLLQIATVKRILGQYAEARADFEALLSTNQKYVPALKGLAETCLNQAKLYNKNQLLGLTRDCCQCALENLLTAIKERNNFSCLWKLAADGCYLVAQLPEKYCCLLIPASLVDESDDGGSKIMEMDDLFLMATRYYSKSILLSKSNILIWHDLASCYLSYAKSVTDPRKAKTLYDKALMAAQYCTKENPSHWEHWNLLGNIAISKDPSDYALAQHAFIKAITVEHNSAEAWTNLGSLYLKLDEFKLANAAFARAQRADPTYVNSWVGQAIIAETMGAEEAMDLFRHSTQLGMQMQGALGYGQWVCQTLIDSPPHTFIYAIHKMHAVPVACDALTWYIERNPYDSCAWNMLGILRERLGMKATTLEAFTNAYKKCIEIYRDKAKINMGRINFRLGKYKEAIDFYQSVKEANFKSGSGLALARFKAKQYEESYEEYEAALHWLTDEQSHQSDLLVALASMAYTFQGPDAAKTLLFQSVKCNPPSPFAYYAILALGLLNDDFKLAEAAVKEMTTLKDRKECLSHTSTLLSHFYFKKNEISKGIRELSKLIHRHPDQASLWLSFAILFARCKSGKKCITLAASHCAKIAVKLRETNMDIKLALCIISLLCSIAGDEKQALKAAQKAVHCYPNLSECWCVLIFTLLSNQQTTKNHKFWLKNALRSAKDLDGTSTATKEWLKIQEKIVDDL
ncbi:tetratricopeptide repeat protein 37 [Agrilus planipennis]|uniref:Tetratricopeptide repeat protein 37 n=1 Tax=Agrilus planipennis TaxID=224129 RepID=A0A1W4WL79_AGRPL|nr:tetratricopeptide repeat protein 37 [Agrilus planipennis]